MLGGHKIEETEQFQNALQEQQHVLLIEFDQKMQEIEKERQRLEEGKSEVAGYKDLLVKQRDIMIELTSRLNERDEHNNQLLEELDDFDRVNQ